MKRFLLFTGQDYYPFGGWEDFAGSFATVGEALARVSSGVDWWHVVDTETMKAVAQSHP